MDAGLTVKYEFSQDDDDFGWLDVAVRTPSFSGAAGFWVQWQDVVEWDAKLFLYPIPVGHAVDEEWGQSDSDGSNYQVIVGIRIAPANRTGDLEVRVKLADHIDTHCHCETAFRTTYSEVERFAVELKAVMNREGEEALLTGRRVG